MALGTFGFLQYLLSYLALEVFEGYFVVNLALTISILTLGSLLPIFLLWRHEGSRWKRKRPHHRSNASMDEHGSQTQIIHLDHAVVDGSEREPELEACSGVCEVEAGGGMESEPVSIGRLEPDDVMRRADAMMCTSPS
jgi:hypothetical protein